MTRASTLGVLFLLVALPGCAAFSKGDKAGTSSAQSSTDPAAGTAAATRLTAARGVLENRCASCHTHDHGAFKSYSEDQWVQSGLVKKQNVDGSPLLGYIRGSGVAGPGSMPADGANIAASEIATLKDWVAKMGTEEDSGSGTGTGGSGGGGPSAAQRTTTALTIIKNNCSGCHSGTQTASSLPYSGATVPPFATYTQDVEYSTGGMVEYGLPATSWLVRALRGTGDIGVMPPGGPLSAGDRQTLVDWVSKLGQP